jgi:hypothetical protein
MHVLAIRRPGQRGTRKLLARYGGQQGPGSIFWQVSDHR